LQKFVSCNIYEDSFEKLHDIDISENEFLIPPAFQGSLDLRINFPLDAAFNSKNIKTYVRF